MWLIMFLIILNKMYSIVEYNSNEEIMGCLDFNKLTADSSLEMYWNHKLPDNINSINVDYNFTKKIYNELSSKFPARIFEIKPLLPR